MAKQRPCRRSSACPYPAMKGKQSCIWHWLLKQPAHVQQAYARDRLDTYDLRGGADRMTRVPKERWPDGERWCAGCQSFVPLFYTSGSRCKACASGAAHARRIEETYGLTAEDYDELLRRQGGVCFICRCRPVSKRFAVDHDHKTGENRGLLCSRCNHDLLGGAHDDVVLLLRAAEYLLFPVTQNEWRPTREQVLAAFHAVLRPPAASQRADLPPAPF